MYSPWAERGERSPGSEILRSGVSVRIKVSIRALLMLGRECMGV